MKSKSLPNLVILGPQKCGTRSLFRWLTVHPQACGSLKKETFYLMDSESPFRKGGCFDEGGWQGYAQHFPAEAPLYPARVEATTHYLYQRTALRVLAEIEDAHVCVVLRDPAVRVWSSFNYTQNNLARIPANVTFEQYLEYALRCEPLPADYCDNRKSAFVLQRDVLYGEYARFLKPWLERLGSERVHCVLFEQLKEQPRDVVEGLLAPFSVDTSRFEHTDFAASNETYTIKHQGLHLIARRINEKLQGSDLLRAALKRLYLRLQGRGAPEKEAHEAALERLRAHYEPHNKALEDLLSVDLSAWMPTSRQATTTTNCRHGA